MADQEQLDLLAQGVEAWNQWKTDTHGTAPAPKWNLSYDADLSDADLSGVNLDGVNLGKVDLSGANCAALIWLERALLRLNSPRPISLGLPSPGLI